MKAEIRTRRFIACPKCGQGENPIDHLGPGTSWGTWYCDECGVGFSGTIGADGTVDVEVSDGERKIETWDLLVLKPQDRPVYFVVPGMRFEPSFSQRWNARRALPAPTQEREHESKRFLYEEHSCPTNWLKPEHVQIGHDTDPHGLIEYVRSIDDAAMPPEEMPHCGRQSWEWLKVFPELMTAYEE